MEVNVACASCGQRFEFEIEPVDGQMPGTVACPTCGADGTEVSNAFIQQKLAAAAPVSLPAAAPSSGLRINRPAAHAPAVPPPSPASYAPSRSVPAPTKRVAKPPSDGFLKGVVGALIGGAIGMFGWFLLVKLMNGGGIGYAAWGVGLLTGAGARVVGAEGSQKLALVTAMCALLAIIGGKYLAVRSLVGKEFEKMAVSKYQSEVNEANGIVAIKTDDEIKAYLAKEDGKNISQVTADEIKEFKEKTVPVCQDLIAGKPSQAAFVAEVMSRMNNSFAVQWEILKSSFSVFTILWIVLGVGSAYKLGLGVEEKVTLG